jgi:hypothetical protein
MTDLSRPAQAVMNAATNGNTNVVNDPVYRQCIAAALRAAADQVVPEQPHEDTFEYCCDYAQSRTMDAIRHQLLNIAAELEGQ